MNRRLASNGFTLFEAATSTAVIAVLMLAALPVARSTMKTTESAVASDADQAEVKRTEGLFADLLMSASQASLLGIPVSGNAAEVMLDEITYKEIQFRRVTGWYDGAPIHDPPMEQAAARLYLGPGRNGDTNDLYLAEGGVTSVLASDIESFSVVRCGNRLTLTVGRSVGEGDYGNTGVETSSCSVSLLVP